MIGQPSASERFAVYGSLRPGESNAHVLVPLGGDWQPCRVRGHRSDNATYGNRFPGFVLDETAAPVEMMLVESARLPAHWARLDAFEGPAYRRVVARAELDSGAIVEAMIYVLAREEAVPGAPTTAPWAEDA